MSRTGLGVASHANGGRLRPLKKSGDLVHDRFLHRSRNPRRIETDQHKVMIIARRCRGPGCGTESMPLLRTATRTIPFARGTRRRSANEHQRGYPVPSAGPDQLVSNKLGGVFEGVCRHPKRQDGILLIAFENVERGEDRPVVGLDAVAGLLGENGLFLGKLFDRLLPSPAINPFGRESYGGDYADQQQQVDEQDLSCVPPRQLFHNSLNAKRRTTRAAIQQLQTLGETLYSAKLYQTSSEQSVSQGTGSSVSIIPAGLKGYIPLVEASGWRCAARAIPARIPYNPGRGVMAVNATNPCQPVRRLYMDNAATSFPKPPSVLAAMNHYAASLGASAGRGAYAEAVETGRLSGECRRRLCKLFHGERPEHFIFTLNCSGGLNQAIKGLVDPSRKIHAICTHIDHNSVLRPMNALVDAGLIEQTRLPVDGRTGLVDPDDVRRAIRPDTRFVSITHASNVTGTLQPLRDIGLICRERDVVFVVDAAQSAGHLPIDVQADCIDLLAAPGHKGLLGPLGTGVLYVRPGIEKVLRPIMDGGTGSVSEQDRQPDFLPDKYEPGSHNAIGIAGLSAGVQWVLEQGLENLHRREMDLVRMFIDGVSTIEGLRYFGPQGVRHRVGVFSVRLEGYEPIELAAVLESHFGILTRPGLHCAPLIHEAIGTKPGGGSTRFSFGPFLSIQDVKYATDALAEIAMEAAVK